MTSYDEMTDVERWELLLDELALKLELAESTWNDIYDRYVIAGSGPAKEILNIQQEDRRDEVDLLHAYRHLAWAKQHLLASNQCIPGVDFGQIRWPVEHRP